MIDDTESTKELDSLLPSSLLLDFDIEENEDNSSLSDSSSEIIDVHFYSLNLYRVSVSPILKCSTIKSLL